TALRYSGRKHDSPVLVNCGLHLGAWYVLETEQAPEQRVDEVARIHGRRLLRTQRTRQQQRRPQDGRPCLHFTSTTSRGSFRSKAPAGRVPLMTTFSKRMVVWSPVGSVSRVWTGMERPSSIHRRIA